MFQSFNRGAYHSPPISTIVPGRIMETPQATKDEAVDKFWENKRLKI